MPPNVLCDYIIQSSGGFVVCTPPSHSAELFEEANISCETTNKWNLERIHPHTWTDAHKYVNTDQNQNNDLSLYLENHVS